MSKPAKMVTIPVAEVGRGETFGDIEMVYKNKRMMTAICVSDKATLYTLPKNVFFKYLN